MEMEKAQAEHRPNYLLVYIGLLILTGVEVAVSQLSSLGGTRLPLLIVLSLGKALLVVLYYMHLKIDSHWYAIILVFGVVFGIGLIGTFLF